MEIYIKIKKSIITDRIEELEEEMSKIAEDLQCEQHYQILALQSILKQSEEIK